MLSLDNIKIGFIGYGNMAGAIAKGLAASGAVKPEQLYAAARDYDKLCQKAAELGIQPCKDVSELADACDIIFIAVKPYKVKDVMSPLADRLENKIIISVAAGIYHEDLETIMPGSHHLATVPNTPVSVCEGVFVCEENILRVPKMLQKRRFRPVIQPRPMGQPYPVYQHFLSSFLSVMVSCRAA